MSKFRAARAIALTAALTLPLAAALSPAPEPYALIPSDIAERGSIIVVVIALPHDALRAVLARYNRLTR